MQRPPFPVKTQHEANQAQFFHIFLLERLKRIFKHSAGNGDTVQFMSGVLRNTEFDLVIIGSGAAGFSTATHARSLGLEKIALIERGTLWGTCVNYGCVPSKFLITLGEILHAGNYHHPGIHVSAEVDLQAVLREKESIIRHSLEKKYEALVDKLGVEIIRGEAAFDSPGSVRVNDRVIHAPRFVVATGSSPVVPPVDGLAEIHPMTNVEALDPESIPARLIVIGGRTLGLEFAQLYAHLGSKVTVLQRSPSLIPEEDPEIATLMKKYLQDEGIDIRTGVDLVKAGRSNGEIQIASRIDGKPAMFIADAVLTATGRRPNTRELHPENAGIATGKGGEIIVDEFLMTSTPHIWAAGDVLGDPQLEVAAKVGGVIAAENAVNNSHLKFDRSFLPHAVFTTPQVAAIGMTEAAARSSGLAAVSRSVMMETLVKSSIIGDKRGMIKIVAEKGSGRILGVHICSPQASEIIMEGVLAVKYRLTVQDLAETFHVFPTLGEAFWLCARAFHH